MIIIDYIDTKLQDGKNKIFHAFMMGTNINLDGKENITVMQFMEDKAIKIAKENQFSGIVTTS